jgi:hypothetical protein
MEVGPAAWPVAGGGGGGGGYGMVGGRGAGAVTAVFCSWIRWTGEGLVGVQFGSVGTACQPPTSFAQVGRTKKYCSTLSLD